MATFDQVPFGIIEFADNPAPRCPCVLILDTSGSMVGEKIRQLNQGLQIFSEQLRSDEIAAQSVEVAIVTFGPVQTVQPFITADAFRPTTLVAQNDTPMGLAIMNSIALVAERKEAYRLNGIGYYRPWLFLITDGAPTDDIAAATAAIQVGEDARTFMFYSVGVEGADFECLSRIAVRKPLQLRGLSFRELFVWLSNSLGSVSRSQPGDEVPLVNPTAPNGWAVAG